MPVHMSTKLGEDAAGIQIEEKYFIVCIHFPIYIQCKYDIEEQLSLIHNTSGLGSSLAARLHCCLPASASKHGKGRELHTPPRKRPEQRGTSLAGHITTPPPAPSVVQTIAYSSLIPHRNYNDQETRQRNERQHTTSPTIPQTTIQRVHRKRRDHITR